MISPAEAARVWTVFCISYVPWYLPMSNIPAQRATNTGDSMALTKRRGFAEARSDQSDTSETELLTKDEPRSPSETPKAGSGPMPSWPLEIRGTGLRHLDR